MYVNSSVSCVQFSAIDFQFRLLINNIVSDADHITLNDWLIVNH
jgi:hypothetical protein